MERKRRYYVLVAIVALLIAAYAAAGFLAVPYFARRALQDFVHAHYQRTLTIGAIHFNPFTFTAEATGVSLPDADGERLLSFERLRVNLELASLWRLGPSLGEILLEKPYVRAVIRRDGALNLADLGRGFESTPAPAPKPVEKSKPLRFFIDRLEVIDGAARFEDHTRPTPFRADFHPIAFALRNFSTVAGRAGNGYALDAASPDGERVTWTGNLQLTPLASHGTFEIANLKAHSLWSYIEDSVAFELDSGVIGIKGEYDLASASGPLNFKLDVHETTVRDLGVKPKGGAEDYVKLGALEVSETRLDLNRRSVEVAKVELKGADIKAWLDADHRPNLLDLVSAPAASGSASVPAPAPTAPAPAAPASSSGGGPAWSVSVPDIGVQGLKVSAEDRSTTPAAAVLLDPLNLHVTGFNLSPDDTIDITFDSVVNGSGKIAAKGKLAPRSLNTNLHVDIASLPLTLAQPYIAQSTQMTLLQGTLGSKADIEGKLDEAFSVKGDVQIADLRTVDNALKEDFIKWKELRVANAKYRSKPKDLRIGSATFVELYLRMIVAPDKTLNVSQILKPPGAAKDTAPAAESTGAPAKPATPTPATAAAPAAATEPTSFPLSIGTVRFVNASLNYADLWIKPNFAVGIQTLNGTIQGLSSDPQSRAKVSLDGKVDRYAPARISGEMNLLSAALYTDITLSLKDVDLTIVNPYSGHFAGYQINKGKLSVDVTYKIDNRKLDAQQHFVIDQLELGDRVESPDAVHLPLKIAVVLLSDRHGVIDLNLPMSGTLDDPSFRVGPLIWKAFVNLITKAVAAPFALLGHLFGGGPEMNVIEFLPGSAELEKPVQDQLAALNKSLQERPQIKLDVPIVYSATLDRPQLAATRLHAELLARVADTRAGRKNPDAALESALADPQQHFRLLLDQYQADFGKDAPLPPSVQAVQAAKRNETPPYEEAIADLNSAFTDRIQVPDADLQALGKQRAQAIQDALLSNGQVDPGRVFIVNAPPKADTGSKVRVELALH